MMGPGGVRILGTEGNKMPDSFLLGPVDSPMLPG